jgi:CheY-like chemotaxis protein
MTYERIEVGKTSASSPSPSILIVEDDADLRNVLTEIVATETPYSVFSACNAAEAWRQVDAAHPALLILDYQLPGMNGLQLYDRLHAARGLDPSQVVFISANLPYRELGFRHLRGIVKPFEVGGFLSLVEHMVDEQSPSWLRESPANHPDNGPFVPPTWLVS